MSTVVGEVQNASRWYEQQRAGLGHALIGELEASGPSRALPWPDPQTLLGRDHGDLKSPDPVEFRETRTEVDAREIGHLCELAYMAGRTDKHRASRYITRRSTTHTR